MKNILLLAFAAILFFACKKEDNQSPDTVCNIENPLKEIEWLKEMHENFEKRQSPAGAKIYQYDYKGQCVFWVDDCFNCADGLIVVYNENQDIICEFGGFAGVDTCPDFDAEKMNEILLYDGVE